MHKNGTPRRRATHEPLPGELTAVQARNAVAWAIIITVAVYLGIGLGALLALTIGPES